MSREPRIRVKALIHSAAMALLLIGAYAPRLASAESLCESCELQIGIGDTYHFWGTTGGVVLPVVLNWSDSRYEFGLFRLSSRQILYDAHSPYGRLMADPYWGVSLSVCADLRCCREDSKREKKGRQSETAEGCVLRQGGSTQHAN